MVDDASQDETPAYLQALDDPRVNVVRQTVPTGVAGARNAGLAAATAPWVAFVDDDDLWAPEKLARQVEALDRNPGFGWSCAGAVLVNQSLEQIGRQEAPAQHDLSDELLRYNVVPGGCSGVVVRRVLMGEVGGFDPALRVLADWDLWIRLALRSSQVGVNEPLLAYVRHEANMTRDLSTLDSELTHIERKYEAVRSAKGITVDRERWLDWIADNQRRAGLRRKPALIWAGSALRTRRPRLLLRAAVAAAYPRWVNFRDLQRSRHIDSAWLRDADAWLAPRRDSQLTAA